MVVKLAPEGQKNALSFARFLVNKSAELAERFLFASQMEQNTSQRCVKKVIFIALQVGKFIWERFKQFTRKYLIFRSILRRARCYKSHA
jgi:hypothetical protein